VTCRASVRQVSVCAGLGQCRELPRVTHVLANARHLCAHRSCSARRCPGVAVIGLAPPLLVLCLGISYSHPVPSHWAPFTSAIAWSRDFVSLIPKIFCYVMTASSPVTSFDFSLHSIYLPSGSGFTPPCPDHS
jgi:hypothetical protein